MFVAQVLLTPRRVIEMVIFCDMGAIAQTVFFLSACHISW
jgi:hypothetical protein